MVNKLGNLVTLLATRRDMVLLFLLAVGLRLLLLLLSVDQIGAEKLLSVSPDTVNYVSMAKGLVNGTFTNENGFFTFGPGYAFFLAPFFFLFGIHAIPVILVQIILSGVACLLIYKLAMILTGSRATSILAGLLAATSYTSVSLSCLVLSDSIYFFFFLTGLVLFLKGLLEGNWRYYILSGILTGIAILSRSIGQFWPLMMIIIALAVHFTARNEFPKNPHLTFKKRVTRSLVCIGIILLLVSSWMIRNYVVHGIPTLAYTSAGGPANVAALTLHRLEGRTVEEIKEDWWDQYKADKKITEWTRGDSFRMDVVQYRRVFQAHPREMFKTYSRLVWTNLNEINHLHRLLLPRYNPMTVPWEHKIKDNGWNYVNFYLSMAGLLLLLVARRFRAFVVLGAVYFYSASMVGFTQWQGSRLFFPGQIAWAISIAVVPIYTTRALGRILRIREKVFPLLKRGAAVVAKSARYLLSYNPETSRFYFLCYAVVILVGLVILFRRFIFSDQMLYGADTLKAGVFFRSFLVDFVKSHGKIPMWNPYIFGGLPFVDAFHGDIFYPFSILKYFGDLFRMLGYILISHIYFAGIFMYLTAREMGLSKIASTLSGISYMFAGYLVSFVAPGHDGKIFATTLFPLTILFASRGFRQTPFLNFTLLGLVIGCMLLAPHPQMSYYVLWCLALFGLYKLWELLRTGKRLLYLAKLGMLLVYSVALGLTISAIQMYPGYVYTTNYSSRETAKGDRWATTFSLHYEELFSLIVPEFCGTDSRLVPESWRVDSETDRRLDYWGRNPFKDNSEYVGTIPVFLALLGFVFYRRKGAFFWGLLCLCSLLYSLGGTTPMFRLYLWAIPMLDRLRQPSMNMFIFSFSTALLAGMFIQSLLDTISNYRTKTLPWFRRLLWGLPLLLLILGILYRLAPEEMLRLYARLFYPWLLLGSDAANTKLERADAYLPLISTGFLFAALFVGGAALLVWLFLTKKLPSRILLLLPALVMINGIRFDQRFISLVDQKTEFGPNPVVQFLKERTDHARAFGFALNEIGFHIYSHGIASTIGYHGNELRWYHDMLHSCYFFKTFFNPRFVNLLGARYVIYPVRGVLPPDTLGPIPLDTAGVFGQYVVFENKNAFPRAYLVNKYQEVPNRKDIYPLVLKGDENLRQMVYLEEKPDLEIDSLAADDSSYAEIDYYEIDSVSIRVNCLTNKLLILTDNYYPAWHAYVDGVKQKIYRAYGSFRAVEIPAGSKQVIFRYHSTLYQRGKLLTFVGFIIAFTVLGLHFLRRIRPAIGKGFGQHDQS